jgi:RNA-binding protein 25
MQDRLVEADADLKDRDDERDELEKLKTEIFSGKYDNPTQEFERQKQEMEDRYRPKILVDVNMDENEPEIPREKSRRDRRAAVQKTSSIDAELIDSDSSGHQFSPHHNNNDDGDDDDMSRSSLLSNSNTPTTPNSPTGDKNTNNQGAGGIGMGFSLSLNKKRKIDPKSAFSMDDEGEEVNGPAKKKLVPLGEISFKFQSSSKLISNLIRLR